MTVPERIAMCAHPNGTHEHVPLSPGEPAPATCFAWDCDCTPVEYVRAPLASREPQAASEPDGLRECKCELRPGRCNCGTSQAPKEGE